jgi:hypothetical protein
MSRYLFGILFSSFSIASTAVAQIGGPNTPCPSAAAALTYDCCPIPNAFQTIVNNPTAVQIIAAPCDEVTTSPQNFPPGFSFSYYGSNQNNFRVNSNGLVLFPPQGAPGFNQFFNECPGDVLNGWDNTPLRSWVAPFWDDFVGVCPGPTDSGVWIDPTGVPGRVIVEWRKLDRWAAYTPLSGTGHQITFQLHLVSPNIIEFHYDPASEFACPPGLPGPGASGCPPFVTTGAGRITATIGVENSNLTNTGIRGTDCTGWEAANEFFPGQCAWPLSSPSMIPTFLVAGNYPLNGYRLTPQNASKTNVSYTVANNNQPWVSIANNPNAVLFLGGCNGTTNYDDFGCPCSDPFACSFLQFPWPFTFFGEVSRSFTTMDNGFIRLGPEGGGLPGSSCGYGVSYINPPVLPGTGDYFDKYIAPWWDDLVENVAGANAPPGCTVTPTQIWTAVSGPPGARVLTVEWDHFAFWTAAGTGDGNASFQVRMYENGDEIEFRYDSACFNPTDPTGVPVFTATVGIENCGGTAGAGPPGLTPGFTMEPNPAGGANVSWLFDPCDFGTVKYYGDGTAGTSGHVPQIATNAIPPIAGNPFGLTVTRARPGTGGFLLIGLQKYPSGGVDFGTLLGLPGPLVVYVDLVGSFMVPVSTTGLTTGPAGSGTACIPLPIPPGTPSAAVFAQFFLFDPGAGNTLFSSTVAAEVDTL